MTSTEYIKAAEMREKPRRFGVDVEKGYHLEIPRANHRAVTAHLG